MKMREAPWTAAARRRLSLDSFPDLPAGPSFVPPEVRIPSEFKAASSRRSPRCLRHIQCLAVIHATSRSSGKLSRSMLGELLPKATVTARSTLDCGGSTPPFSRFLSWPTRRTLLRVAW